MNEEEKSWRERSNQSLKGRNLIVVNKAFYYFLNIYFIVTFIVFIFLVCFVLFYLAPFVKQGILFFTNNHEGILNYLNSTI